MGKRLRDRPTRAAVCPEFNELPQKTWEGKRETNLTKLLMNSRASEKAAQFLIDTDEWSQFNYSRQVSSKDSVEEASTDEVPAEDY